MVVLFERGKGLLSINGIAFTVTNNVRNEIDPIYKRKLHEPKEVIYTITANGLHGKPYMPRKFPIGKWKIIGVEWYKIIGGKPNFNKEEFGAVRIRTDAHQPVKVWALDDKRGYDHVTDEVVEDHGYLGHYSNFRTTLGCWRHDTQLQAEKFALLCEEALKDGSISLEVKE